MIFHENQYQQLDVLVGGLGWPIEIKIYLVGGDIIKQEFLF